ncbi:MAG: hypothetical protein AAFX40_11565 [Cyanobacteria bacterium J06639_1]
MSRKTSVEIKGRPLPVELFDPHFEHFMDYCDRKHLDPKGLIQEFIQSLEIPDDEEFISLDDRILNYFAQLSGSKRAPKAVRAKKRSTRAGNTRTKTKADTDDSADLFASAGTK